MIVKRRLPWHRIVLSVRHSTFGETLPRTLFFTASAALVTWLEMTTDARRFTLTIAPFSLIGLAISVFLGFRTNVAYDRYWEGRKLWGALVNVSRSFARQAATFIDAGSEEKNRREVRELVRRTIAFVYALKHSLRHSDPGDEVVRYLSAEEAHRLVGQRNVPLVVTRLMGERLRGLWAAGAIREFHLPVLEGSLEEMTSIQGACERINNTPIPFAYTTLIHRIVGFYCLLLPFGIINEVRWLTPVVVLMVCHAFLGLDEIGDEIEDPFGTDPHDLPLAALCRTIEVNLLQYIDEPELPPMLEPVDGILL